LAIFSIELYMTGGGHS